jgi:hypothetical protein
VEIRNIRQLLSVLIILKYYLSSKKLSINAE